MKKLTLFALCAAACMASCSNGADENKPANGMATLTVNLGVQSGFDNSRALDEAAYKNVANYTVEVTNGNGEVVKTYKPGESLTNPVKVPFGSYNVRAFYGKEQAASRDEFLSQGTKNINIISGQDVSVELTCEPTCGKAVVNFAPEMDTYFTDYYVTYSTKALGSGVATWAKADKEPWYLLVAKDGEEVTATIHLTLNEKYDINKTLTPSATPEGTVARTFTLRPNHAWTLNVKPSYSSVSGEVGISIFIDESTNDKEIGIQIPSEWI